MNLKIFYSLLLLTTMVFSNVRAQQTVKMTPSGIGYLQYLPDGYNGNTNKYPIVISLHGIKEKGNNEADVMKVANVGLPKYVKQGTKYPFILISPQLKTTMGRWTGDYVMQVINYVKTTLRVDPNRIYLTGLSLGGGGVWSVATSYPKVFAAILPICSGYNVLSGANAIANEDLPTWGFHGDADAVVGESVTINMINGINSYKPSPLGKITIFPSMGHVIWDKVYKQTNALDWMLSYRLGSTTSQPEPAPTNSTPVANAGSDKTITLPTNSVTLAGSGTDSNGSIASYSWAKKSGGAATLSGGSTKDLKLSNLVAGSYVFTLTVKDNEGKTDMDDVSVTVKSATATTNKAPIANAGADKKVVLPSTSLSISGSASDSDGSIASYSWKKVSGGSVSMSGTSTSKLNLSGLQAGKYVFRLTVKDNNGATDTDDMLVVVNGTPVASAGADRTVTLPTSSITLTASVTDVGGTISSYAWYKASGPSVKLTNSTSKTVTLSGLVQGTYEFKLAVKDSFGWIGYDYVKVTVKGSVASIEVIAEPGTALASTYAPDYSFGGF